MYIHEKEKHGVKKEKLKCEFCNIIIKSSLNQHNSSYSHLVVIGHEFPDEDTKVQNCQCCRCKETFPCIKAYREHYETTHRQREAFVCLKCPARFDEENDMNDHVEAEHPADPLDLESKPVVKKIRKFVNEASNEFRCEICKNKNFGNKTAFNSHLQSFAHALETKNHPEEDSKIQEIDCSRCDVTFLNYKQFREHYQENHMRKVNEVKPIECDHCDAYFKTADELKKHVTKVHYEKRKSGGQNKHIRPIEKKCVRCRVYKKNDKLMRKHHLTAHKEVLNKVHIECFLCNETFVYKQFWEHYYDCLETPRDDIIENDAVTFHVTDDTRCKICNTWLKTKKSLQKHMDILHNNAKLNDLVKEKSLAKPVEIYVKPSVATKKQKFQCQHCGVIYDNKVFLVQHMQFHLNTMKSISINDLFDEPEQCKVCDKIFTLKYDFQRHIAQEHKGATEPVTMAFDIDPMTLLSDPTENDEEDDDNANEDVDPQNSAEVFTAPLDEKPTKFACHICKNDSFTRETYLQRHLSLFHKMDMYPDFKNISKIATKNENLNIASTSSNVDDDLGFQHNCHLCKNKFQKEGHLLNHLTFFHKLKPNNMPIVPRLPLPDHLLPKNQCQKCLDLVNAEPKKLQDHIIRAHKVSVNVGPSLNQDFLDLLKCEFCEAILFSENTKNRHMNNFHTNELKARIDQHNKKEVQKRLLGFPNSKPDNLTKVGNERSKVIKFVQLYSCNLCPLKAHTVSMIKKHMKAEHKWPLEKPLGKIKVDNYVQCVLCEIMFTNRGQLDSHNCGKKFFKVPQNNKAVVLKNMETKIKSIPHPPNRVNAKDFVPPAKKAKMVKQEPVEEELPREDNSKLKIVPDPLDDEKAVEVDPVRVKKEPLENFENFNVTSVIDQDVAKNDDDFTLKMEFSEI